MFLTQKRQTPQEAVKFPIAQLFVLALVRVAEPIALTSIFPYAWKLVLHFQFGDKSNASLYAGVLISAFALAESLTGMYWGGLSDRIGRKPVLLIGCLGTVASLLITGFATNFWVALLGRFLGGALNGNIGVIQTMVGELVSLPEHEPKAYAVMPFVWSVGTIVGPSIGGYFADPALAFPDTFSDEGIFGRYPYLLPNVICICLMIISITAGCFFLQETHPDKQPLSLLEDLDDPTATTPCLPTKPTVAVPAANIVQETYGTFNAIEERNIEEHWTVNADGSSRTPSISSISSTPDQKVFTKRVIMLTIALGIFTYHSMTYDHLLPIFLQDDRIAEQTQDVIGDADFQSGAFAGGLGMSTQQTGVIMSIDGIIALVIQAVIFPLLASWLGVWKTLILVTVGHPIVYLVVPVVALLPENLVLPGIYVCLAIRNFFTILAYPLLLILIKEASPTPSCLGRINGLAASTGAACRTIASPIAGYLYGVGIKSGFTPLAWWASALVALLGAIQAFFITRQRSQTEGEEQIAVPCPFAPKWPRRGSVDYVKDPDSGYNSADERSPLLLDNISDA